MFLKVSQIPQENNCVGVSFFLKMMKLYKDIFSAWISCTSAKFFSYRWRHKCLKNTTDLLLFYQEHLYGFLGSDLWKHWKKNIHFTTNYIFGSQTFWSFMKFYFVHIVKVFLSLKNSHFLYITPYMHKILPALGNEKE